MATTLSYGIIKPQTGDRGSVFFPALEAALQQLNDHDHDGTDSARLTSTSLTITTQAVSAASWAAVAGHTGLYKQLVTMPGSLQYDEHPIQIRDGVSKELCLLTVERVSGNTFYVYSNDNTQTLAIIY